MGEKQFGGRDMRISIIAATLLAGATAVWAQTPEWQFYQDSKATNGLLLAFVQSADGTQLMLKCDRRGKGNVYALFVSKQALAPQSNRDVKGKIKFRFDDGASREVEWRFRQNTARAINAPGDRTLTRFLGQLSDADRMEAEIYPIDSLDLPITAQFDVHDAGDAIAKVYDSCKDKNPVE